MPILYKGYNLTMNWGASMERAFGNLGAEFQVYDPNFDTDKMTRIISDLIARKAADVLILHNPDVGVLSKQIEDAQRAGIYTVVVNMISSRLGDAYIGVDNLAAAEDIAQRAVQDCEKRGAPKRLAIIDGPGNDAASLLWSKGVHNVLDLGRLRSGHHRAHPVAEFAGPAGRRIDHPAAAQQLLRILGDLRPELDRGR